MTPWKGEVAVRKKSADFVIESALAGVSSSLPEPFNKNAGSISALRIEKSNLPDGGDQIRVSLGKVLEALIERRSEGKAWSWIAAWWRWANRCPNCRPKASSSP